MSRPTLFGRYQVAEPPESFTVNRHVRTPGITLKAVDHEPAVAVLDQEDLIKQGIDTSQVVPGAAKVDALGSCTANAFTAALSNLNPDRVSVQMTVSRKVSVVSRFDRATGAAGFTDTKGAEEFAIRFYHGCTDQTGSTSEEWPPTDCGSSGPFITEYATTLGLVSGEQVAHTPDDLVSLMQADGVLTGSPWYNAWMTPTSDGFIDSGGIEAAMASGIAGGHETYFCAVEKLVLTATGAVTLDKTIGRARNSWTKSWGDAGCYRFRFSTFAAIAGQCDHRQLVAVS